MLHEHQGIRFLTRQLPPARAPHPLPSPGDTTMPMPRSLHPPSSVPSPSTFARSFSLTTGSVRCALNPLCCFLSGGPHRAYPLTSPGLALSGHCSQCPVVALPPPLAGCGFLPYPLSLSVALSTTPSAPTATRPTSRRWSGVRGAGGWRHRHPSYHPAVVALGASMAVRIPPRLPPSRAPICCALRSPTARPSRRWWPLPPPPQRR